MERDLEKAHWALDLIQQRQSVRSFTDQPIPEETLHEILSAGINAATGGNLQPYSIIVEKDRERCRLLADLCGGQEFMAQAAVNLIFLMDWHKLAVYSRAMDAPFTANKSIDHFLIALEDLVCAAQTIETAAWLHGIGSCYVGTVLDVIPQCVELYHLPKLTAPTLILSLGYPKGLTARRKKLGFEHVVFDGTYPALSQEQICQAYDQKYAGMRTTLPQDAERRQAWLADFKRALLTTFNEEKSAQVIKAADEKGSISEIQRRFGLHYHAEDMLDPRIIQSLADQGIYPFTSRV